MPDRTTDELLLQKAEGGDQAAFVELYHRHRNGIFRFAYRLLGSVETAEDITHDCLLSLIRRPGGFNPARGSLRSYLYAAARNLAMKHFRGADREANLDELAEEIPLPLNEQPLRKLLDHELASKVKEAVLDLPPLQREVLILVQYEGFSLNEVASVVGADVGAVKARLHRARQRLKSTLSNYLNTSAEIVTLEKA